MDRSTITRESGSGVSYRDREESSHDEDRLTASFFGISRNLSNQVWQSILPALVLGDRTVSPRTVKLWPTGRDWGVQEPRQLRDTEPDVVLEFPDRLVFVEVKDKSGFSRASGDVEAQLVKEWKLGERDARSYDSPKDFHLVTLTRNRRQLSADVERQLREYNTEGRVHCVFWEDVYTGLNGLEKFSDNTEENFVGELVGILKARGFHETYDPNKERSYSDFIDSETAERFLTKLAETLAKRPDEIDLLPSLTVLPRELSSEVQGCILDALEILVQSPELRSIPHEFNRERILANFLLADSSLKNVSEFFFRLLHFAYYHDKLRVFGKNDFSIGISTPAGKISVLTAFSNDMRIKFHLLRKPARGDSSEVDGAEDDLIEDS